MEIIVFLSIVIAVLAVLTSIFLVRRVKKQIAEMTDEMCIRDSHSTSDTGASSLVFAIEKKYNLR